MIWNYTFWNNFNDTKIGLRPLLSRKPNPTAGIPTRPASHFCDVQWHDHVNYEWTGPRSTLYLSTLSWFKCVRWTDVWIRNIELNIDLLIFWIITSNMILSHTKHLSLNNFRELKLNLTNAHLWCKNALVTILFIIENGTKLGSWSLIDSCNTPPPPLPWPTALPYGVFCSFAF